MDKQIANSKQPLQKTGFRKLGLVPFQMILEAFPFSSRSETPPEEPSKEQQGDVEALFPSSQLVKQGEEAKTLAVGFQLRLGIQPASYSFSHLVLVRIFFLFSGVA